MTEPLDRRIADALPAPGRALVWWLGQNGFVVRGRRGIVLVDPFVSDSISSGLRPYTHERLVPPVLELGDREGLEPEAVLITHEHVDHCDNVYLTRLAAMTSCRFVGSSAVRDRLRSWGIPEDRIETVRPGTVVRAEHGEVEATDAVHVPGAVGFVVRLADGPTLYFAGDTGLFLGMRDLGARQLDAAFLPINGQDDNLGIDGALIATSWLRAPIVVPTHYGMFADNTERPERLAHSVVAAGLPARVAILAHAEMFEVEARG